jgi:hypothetical protein
VCLRVLAFEPGRVERPQSPSAKWIVIVGVELNGFGQGTLCSGCLLSLGKQHPRTELSPPTFQPLDLVYDKVAGKMYCKVSVIASPAGVVTQFNTEDANICSLQEQPSTGDDQPLD